MMPSVSLRDWRSERLPRLAAFDAQCTATSAAAAANPELADENLRGYVMLLAAHFQGFCRDLHSECGQAVTATLPVGLRSMVLAAFESGRELDRGNPRYQTIREDFYRFGLDLSGALAADPANAVRVSQLDELNSWRNYAAHRKATPPRGGPLGLPLARGWKQACDELAAELDRILYNQLMSALGRRPW